MHDILHALEKVNVDSNPSDDRIKKNIMTVEDLEMYYRSQPTTHSPNKNKTSKPHSKKWWVTDVISQ